MHLDVSTSIDTRMGLGREYASGRGLLEEREGTLFQPQADNGFENLPVSWQRV